MILTLPVLFSILVVTGATAGIGRDFALQLAGAGFNIFLASRTQSKLEDIAAEIGKLILDLRPRLLRAMSGD